MFFTRRVRPRVASRRWKQLSGCFFPPDDGQRPENLDARIEAGPEIFYPKNWGDSNDEYRNQHREAHVGGTS
jgi:hypothetical protein